MDGFINEDCRECKHYQHCYPKIKRDDNTLASVFEHLKAIRNRQLCAFNDKMNYKGRR